MLLAQSPNPPQSRANIGFAGGPGVPGSLTKLAYIVLYMQVVYDDKYNK